MITPTLWKVCLLKMSKMYYSIIILAHDNYVALFQPAGKWALIFQLHYLLTFSTLLANSSTSAIFLEATKEKFSYEELNFLIQCLYSKITVALLSLLFMPQSFHFFQKFIFTDSIEFHIFTLSLPSNFTYTSIPVTFTILRLQKTSAFVIFFFCTTTFL